MSHSSLYIFAGLPATGKSRLAQLLAKKLGATYLRIDTIEQALGDFCSIEVEGEGYRLSYRIAADNLRIGLSVVADSCNPIGLTRREWESVARSQKVAFTNIEVICSDVEEHRRRVENRVSTIQGLKLPTWTDVVTRHYEGWDDPDSRVVIDTARRSENAAFDLLCDHLRINDRDCHGHKQSYKKI